MGLLNKRKSDSGKKNDGHPKGDQSKSQTNRQNKKQTIYVTVSSHKAIFLVTGEPRESKYSYGVPIIPLHGYYYASKFKRTFTAGELRDYYVILNVPKDSVSKVELDDMCDANVVVVGYHSYEVYLDEPDEEEDEESGDEDSEEKVDVKKGERDGDTRKK